MSANDILNSIHRALWEEEAKASRNREIFNRDEVTIFISEEAYLIVSGGLDGIYVVPSERGLRHKCMGCNLKIISEEGIKVYIGKQCTIFEEGAEE